MHGKAVASLVLGICAIVCWFFGVGALVGIIPVSYTHLRFQFLRLGYFAPDNKDSAPGHLVFNRAVALKDSFKKD